MLSTRSGAAPTLKISSDRWAVAPGQAVPNSSSSWRLTAIAGPCGTTNWNTPRPYVAARRILGCVDPLMARSVTGTRGRWMSSTTIHDAPSLTERRTPRSHPT